MTFDDILNNDNAILEATARSVAPTGRIRLTFNLPDGPPVVGELTEKMDMNMAIAWCNTVRSAWRARQDRKETEALSKAASRDAAATASNTNADNGAGSPEPVESDTEDGEEDVEVYLESKIHKARNAYQQAVRDYDSAEARLRETARVLNKYERQLKLIREADASVDSAEDS